MSFSLVREPAHAAEPKSSTAKPSRRLDRIEQLQHQVEALLPRMRIAVVYGGDKNAEGAVISRTGNARSWKSYKAVAQDIANALERLGAVNVQLIPDDMLLGERLRRERIDLVWLNTGGVQGFNPMSHAAAMMEMFGIPYVGHDPLTSGMLDNKHVFKRELAALGLPTAPFMTWHSSRGAFEPERNAAFRRVFAGYSGPFVVKPVSGRASLHVHVVDDAAQLDPIITEICEKTENQVLIESFLGGAEYCVAVSGPIIARQGRLQRLVEPFVFATVERVLSPDEQIFTSMDHRPITTDRIRVMSEAADAQVVETLTRLGREVFVEMSLESLIRLDLRADSAGRIFVLEANPKPDLKAPTADVTSLIGSALGHYGMDYDDLILSLLADRIDLLFCRRRGMAHHLSALIA
jgi:D-alanine-D-alanine ligase